MAFGLHGVVQGKKALRRTLSGLKEAALKSTTVPKGYFVVYVGQDEKKRYVGACVVSQRTCISRIAKCGRGRVWISSYDGWTHNSLQ